MRTAEARKLIQNCSLNGQCITFKDFLYVMTRPGEEEEGDDDPDVFDIEDNEATPMASERMKPVLENQ